MDTSEGNGRLEAVSGASDPEAEPAYAADLSAAESTQEAAAGVRRLVGAGLALPAEASLTIPGLLLDVVASRGRQVALRAKRMGIYQNISWIDLFDKISRIGLGLRALGVRRGDRVAIIGDPLPEWLVCDFAVQCLGAISYGLYPTSSRDEVGFVLRNGGASVLIAEDQEHVDKVLPLLGQLPDLRKLVVIDDSNMFGYADPALMSLNDLIGLGTSVAGGPDEYLRLCREVRPDDPATIVYTSGTSANPKGAVYTHRALITQGHQFFAFPELDGAGGLPQRRSSSAQSSLRAHEHAARDVGKGNRPAFWRRAPSASSKPSPRSLRSIMRRSRAIGRSSRRASSSVSRTAAPPKGSVTKSPCASGRPIAAGAGTASARWHWVRCTGSPA